jgi:hypothetical protein
MRHRENISRSMITGYMQGAPGEAIHSGRPAVAAAYATIAVLLAARLFRNYDAARRETTLPLIGTVIHLGAAEHES